MCKFVNSFGKLGLIAALLVASAPALAQIPGAPVDLDDAIDQSLEDAVEEAVSQSVESDVEETVESTVETAIEQTVEGGVQDSVESAIENGVAGAVESALEESVTGDVEEAVSSVVENSVLGGALEETLEETAGAASPILSAAAQGETQSGGGTVEIVVEDGRRVIRHEWVLVVGTEEAAQVEALGAPIVMRAPLEASGDVLFVVNISDDDPNAGEIQEALSELGGGRFDRNSLFDATSNNAALAPAHAPERKSDLQNRSDAGAVGLIDTAVETGHPALAAARITAQDFVSIGGARPLDHGTAVASLLVESLSYGKRADAPEIRAASVFFRTSDGATGATTASLVRAIDWLRGEGVGVVNISLAGAQNSVLERMIRSAQEDGMVFVAAVGNDGPAARPLYPAAYEDVIGVTAVDENGEAYRWALQGPQVDVAARGVNVRVARAGGGHMTDSGTSLAAPVVASFLAQHLAPRAGPEAAMDAIRKSVTPGDIRDDVIGYGLLAPNVMN